MENNEKPCKMMKMSNDDTILCNKSSTVSDDRVVTVKCQFYMKKKKRSCKMDAHKGSKYCVVHAYEVGIALPQSDRKRITCPLDPKHSCYESQLEKHLKKCNSRPQLLPSCYVKNINCGDDEGEDPHLYKVGIQDVSDEVVLQLVATVNKLHSEHVGELENRCLFHEVLQSEADKPMNGPSAQKHIRQQASLIGHMRDVGLLADNRTYLEFGAGKGGLSHWVQKAMLTFEHNQYILVDKSSVRYKMDTYHRGSDQGPSFERLKLDIQHLHLGKVPSLQNDIRPIVGCGKHLCGGATDLMLRCVVETPHTSEHSLKSNVSGFVLALCCHHRCDWSAYCGKQFFRQCGLGARDFHLVTSMTSWATCATKHVPEILSGESVSDDHKDPVSYNHHRYGNLLPQEREEIGRRCKQLIDKGRVDYLNNHGFHGRQLIYIGREHTLENMAIVATSEYSKTGSE